MLRFLFSEAVLEEAGAWEERTVSVEVTKHREDELINKTIRTIDRKPIKIDSAGRKGKHITVSKTKQRYHIKAGINTKKTIIIQKEAVANGKEKDRTHG